MEVEGQIVDSNTGNPLPNASIMIVDGNGALQGGDIADELGNFYLDSVLLDNPAAKVEFSYVGYDKKDLTPATVNVAKVVSLTSNATTLPTVTVLGKKVSSVWIWYLAGGAALIALYFLVYKKKKKKMGKIEPVEALKLAALIGIPVAAYFLIIKPLLDAKTGIGENNAITQQQTAATAAAAVQAQQAAGVTQRLTDSELNSIATTLDQQLDKLTYNPPIGYPDDVVNQVIQVGNTLEWYKLVQEFGTRKFNTGGSVSVCSLVGLMCDSLDLPTALNLILPKDKVSNINSYFSEQGIAAQI